MDFKNLSLKQQMLHAVKFCFCFTDGGKYDCLPVPRLFWRDNMDYYVHFVNPDLIKFFLITANGVLVSVTLLLFVVLIVHKVHVERRQKRLNDLHSSYAELLTRKQSDADLELEKPRNDLEYEALGDAIIEMMAENESETASYLRTLARALEVDVYNQRRAVSRSWVDRYRAIEMLGFLKLQELEPFYYSILQKEKNIHVITKTIWSLSLIAEENDLKVINNFLADPLFASSKFKEYIYTNIIRAFQERNDEWAFLRLLDFWEDSPDIPVLLKKDIISACGAAGLTKAKRTIIRYYEKFGNITEMKIVCIRALEKLGEPDMYPIIISALRDEDWRVRAVAAKNAEVCSEMVVDALASVLKDRNYYVRINAAQALSMLGERGLAVLTRYTSSDDHFARDMAHYMLSR
jgi:HEAT repeat protein